MGLFLRKKSSKASLKAAKDERRGGTPPPQLPPLPDHIRRAEEAAAAAAAAGATTQSPMAIKAARRRSRSLWADSDEAKAASPFSSAGDLASQPWRSHDAWMAFQNPTAPKAVLDELVFPCSPTAAPGWRGRSGGGLFSTEGMIDQQMIRRAGTPTAPSSPVSTTHFSPSPSVVTGRKLDFGSPLAGEREERAVTPPESLLMTPRARAGSYSGDRAPDTGSSPGHGVSPDGVLLTPNSSLLPSFNSRSPSPASHTTESANPVQQPSSLGRSPRRALPPPPSEPEVQPMQPETEVIDFTRPEPVEAPIMPRSSIPKRSSSSASSQYMHARSSPSPVPFASPVMSSSPLPGAYDAYAAPMRLPAPPNRRPSTGSTPSMLPYTQVSPVQQTTRARPAPRSYEQPAVPAPRPPSRNTSSGSHNRNPSRPTSNGASSSGHGHSGYHSDAASVPVPHTPEGIAQAVSIWRQKSQRREVEAAIAAGVVNPGPQRLQQKEWENPDVFAAAGAWEASGSYNPYDAAEFEQKSFTAPLRLPKPPGPIHAMPPIVRRPSAGHAVQAAHMRSPRVQQQVAQPGWI